MNKKILILTLPFALEQTMHVYEDDSIIATKKVKMNDLEREVTSLAKEYDVNRIDLFGSEQFNRGLVKKIKEEEMTKFNKNELEINLV